jgi:small subunit ribosomal protein S6e
MKFNIADPRTGQVKVFDIEDDRKIMPFLDRRMGHEIEGDVLGDEFKGYLFRIAGGNDKQGFPMMQGVMTNTRVRLLFKKGMKTFRERRAGSRKRKSVRGCIIGSDIAVCCLTILRKGDAEIAGLTDEQRPRRLGPKRASNIRKLFGLSKQDDVRKFVVRREIEKDGKKRYKAPKIQRLVTPANLQRKRRIRNSKVKAVIAHRKDQAEWKVVKAKYLVDERNKRAEESAKKKAAGAK